MEYDWGVDRLRGIVCGNNHPAQADEGDCLAGRSAFATFLFNSGSDTDHDTRMAVVVFCRSYRLMGFAGGISLQTWQVNAGRRKVVITGMRVY